MGCQRTQGCRLLRRVLCQSGAEEALVDVLALVVLLRQSREGEVCNHETRNDSKDD